MMVTVTKVCPAPAPADIISSFPYCWMALVCIVVARTAIHS